MPTDSDADNSLETELAYFEANRDALVEQACGKFALIKEQRVLGLFDTQLDAIRHGYQELGNKPFLVKQILPVDIPLKFTSFNLGVVAGVCYDRGGSAFRRCHPASPRSAVS